MPIYEYRCTSCDTRFEELVSASAKTGPPCPSCGAKKPKRLFSTFATEWLPGDVAWHKMPNKHDMGGPPDPTSASIPRSIGDGKKSGGKKKAKG
jgi:putative FmdB family regulatory protein